MIRHWPAAFEGRDGGPAQCSRRLQQIYRHYFRRAAMVDTRVFIPGGTPRHDRADTIIVTWALFFVRSVTTSGKQFRDKRKQTG